MFIRIRKGYRRLYCSSVLVMLNHTAVKDSKGASFPLYFTSEIRNCLDLFITPMALKNVFMLNVK